MGEKKPFLEKKGKKQDQEKRKPQNGVPKSKKSTERILVFKRGGRNWG